MHHVVGYRRKLPNLLLIFYGDLLELRKLNQQSMLPMPQCQACVSQESAGAQSMRLGYLVEHGKNTFDATLQYLDINIDYTCNLACVTCGPSASTTWRKELGIKNYFC